MSTQTETAIALVERGRVEAVNVINAIFDKILTDLAPSKPTAEATIKMPTLADGHDPRNKNGLNLTPRGVEILFRVFDDAGGYNRAAKMLNITQAAAKNRKAQWVNAGGVQRQKMLLDIDSPAN